MTSAPPNNVVARRLARFYGVAIACGLLLRLVDVWRPIDASTHHSWRESDLGMIARNFWREDMNILYPRIDWRGDGPGFVECELPLHPWLMAAGYRVFGYHEEWGRLLSLGISLASLAVFHALARRTLPPLQARAALAVFALNPILMRMATTIQPDPGMLLASLIAVLFLLRWREQRLGGDAAAAAAAAALAILLKAPALVLAPLFAAVCIETLGWRQVWRSGQVWGMALLAGLPPLAWYAHAHQFWLIHGNSLGLSNEMHWLDVDLLRMPGHWAHLLVNAARMEIRAVYGIIGVLPALVGLLHVTRPTRYLLYWVGATALFNLVAIRTSGDTWALYYHALSVPSAALLIGLGLPAGAPAGQPARRRHTPSPAIQTALALATAAALLPMALGRVDWQRTGLGEGPDLQDKFAAARTFQPLIPRDALVVTIGDNPAWDETGSPLAHNDSALLFWLDRRGFTLAREEQQVETLLALQARGARYFTIHADAHGAPAISSHFPILAHHGPYLLGRLPAAPSAGAPNRDK